MSPDAPATAAAPLTVHHATVLPDWVDYNGHMNDACYNIVFSHAIDAFMALLGIDQAHIDNTGHSIYTLETHVCYLQECHQGDTLRVDLQLLAHDSKRLHVILGMYSAAGELLATSEEMLLYVDLSGPRAASFTPPVATNIEKLWAAHTPLPVPAHAGRRFKRLTHCRLPT